jgi:pimeloyl-ACP methyl ester carboxylesterase
VTTTEAEPILNFVALGDESSPPLFLIHGLYGDLTGMLPLAHEFAGDFRVIVVDALGHGESPRPSAFTLEDSGRALNGLIARLGYASASVLGVSMGSYVAAQAAELEAERIERLVLVVTKGQGATSSTLAYARSNGFDLANASLEEMLSFMASALWSPDTSEERRAALLAGQGTPPRELSVEDKAVIDGSMAGFDLRPGLPSITARTLVISGLSDGLNPPEAGREVAELIPGARFEIYEHSGHMLPYEEMDRLVDEVTAFLRE